MPTSAKCRLARTLDRTKFEMPTPPRFAEAGSKRWLQIAVNRRPDLLDQAFREAGAIDAEETMHWCSPIAQTNFAEFRDENAFRYLGIAELPKKSLIDFWPARGPVWDGLATTSKDQFILVEAKAHIPEILSPPSAAGEKSIEKIRTALNEARKFYAPRSSKIWFNHFYQYCNRLAHQYFVAHLNELKSRMVFLDFINAEEVNGPSSKEEWIGTTKLIHAFLGLPESLEGFGVHHAYIDVKVLKSAV